MINIKKTAQNEDLETLSTGDTSLLQAILVESYEESDLDPETFMLVRIASLAAMDAPPSSWLVNLKVGKELGISRDKAVGTLVAISPVIGTARTMSAAGNIIKAIAMDRNIQESRHSHKTVHH